MIKRVYMVWLAVFGGLFQSGCSNLANFFLLHPSHHELKTPATQVVLENGEQPVVVFSQVFGDKDVVPDLFVLALSGSQLRAEEMLDKSQGFFGHKVSKEKKTLEIVSLQYPGFGSDFGKAELGLLRSAAEKAYRYLVEKAGDRPILIHGYSMGSAVALALLASDKEIRPSGVVLEKAPELRSIVMNEYGWWNLWILASLVSHGIPDEMASANVIGDRDDVPVLFIQAKDDEDVPHYVVEDLFHQYRGPKQLATCACGHLDPVIPKNTHSLAANLDWLLSERSSWALTKGALEGVKNRHAHFMHSPKLFPRRINFPTISPELSKK